MILCEQCGGETKYDYVAKTFSCSQCGHSRWDAPVTRRCPQCGREYTEWTWFDPSSCQCGHSFVE